jgi:hypothetical protein
MLQALKRHPLGYGIAIGVGVPLLLFMIWTAVALTFSYSTGERAGYLQKFGKRGWLCKTWEGQIQVNAIPGSTPEQFDFTVRSDSLAGEISKLAGKQIVLTYAEHRGVPGTCFGDTEFFATAVRPLSP